MRVGYVSAQSAEEGEDILALMRLEVSTLPLQPMAHCGIRNCSVRSLIILGQRPRKELQKAYGKVRVSAGFSLSGGSVLSIWDIHLGFLISCCLNTTTKP